MNKRRAFTLVEVIICITLLAVLTGPILSVAQYSTRAYSRAYRLTDLKAEVDRVGFRLQSLSQKGRLDIAEDNRGFSVGSNLKLRWKDGALWLKESQKEYPLAEHVSHFSVFRVKGLIYIVIEMEDRVAKVKRRKRFRIGPQR